MLVIASMRIHGGTILCGHLEGRGFLVQHFLHVCAAEGRRARAAPPQTASHPPCVRN